MDVSSFEIPDPGPRSCVRRGRGTIAYARTT
ncbi:MAG: hypothetical protein JWP58_4599 [Hymenobacter sp.]|jgi:hypothetical protein|nr:hypothetical protein [Hymenobacter sp.]